MDNKILNTPEALSVAKHLLWYLRMYREMPIEIKDIKEPYKKIFEEEFMRALEREVDAHYSEPIQSTEAKP